MGKESEVEQEQSDRFLNVSSDVCVAVADHRDIFFSFQTDLAAPDRFFRDIEGIDLLRQTGKKKGVVSAAQSHVDDGIFFPDERAEVFMDEGIIVHSIFPARYPADASSCRYRSG